MEYLDEAKTIILRNEMRGYYSKLRTQQKKQAQFYDQEMTLPKHLKGTDAHIPPTARTIVNNGVDSLMSLDHLVTVLLWRDTQSAKQTASRIKQFDKAYLSLISKKSKYNIRRMALKHGLIYGEYNVKGPIYVPRMAPEKIPGETPGEYRNRIRIWEDTLDKTFPFVHRVTNPLIVNWDPDVEAEYVFEDYYRPVREILSQHPEWADDPKLRLPSSGMVHWTGFYAKDYKRYMINNSTSYEGENLCGIPYEHGNAGFGYDDEESRPEKLIVGILAPALRTIKSDIILRTTIMYGLQYAVWGKKVISGKPGTLGIFEPSSEPGAYSYIADAYNLRDAGGPPLSPETYRILGMLDQDLQQILPKGNYGQLSKGMTSGSMLNQTIAQGRQQLVELKSQWEQTASNMCNRLHLMLKYIVQEPVGILGTLAGNTAVVKISPAQLHPDIQATSVSLDPMTPEERQGRINLGVLLLRSDAISQETACEEFFGLDYQRESARKLVEDILSSPAIKERLGESALEQAGMFEVFDYLKQQGMQIPEQPGYQDIRRAQDGMQELPRFSDYNAPQLTAGTTPNDIQPRELYGQGQQDQEQQNFE